MHPSSLALVLACAPSVETAGPAPALVPVEWSAWSREVERRIEDATYAFAARPDGTFGARVPRQALRGTFDGDGVRFERGRDGIGLRFAAWGRDGAMTPIGTVPARLGACTDREDPTGACVRRLERAAGAVTEWWTASAAGFEQGFTIERLPPGAGDLVLSLAIEGARVERDGDDLRVHGDAGGAFGLRHLVAWDATGRPLAASFALAGDAVTMRIDDRGAVAPVLVDPIFLSLDDTLAVDAGTNHLGCAFASGSDFDGDGYADVAAGARTAKLYGRVFVYYGSPSGLPALDDQELGDGNATGCFGDAVDGAGDVNGDGYDDLLVGDECDDTVGNGGRAYLFLGGPDGLEDAPFLTWTGTGSDELGGAVAGLGDVNGDGYADVAIGAERAGAAGEAYVHHGAAAGPSATPSLTYVAPAGTYEWGALLAAGDVDGDGYDDLAVGEPGSSARLDVYRGGPAGLATTVFATVTLPNGDAIDGGGDVNGDGRDDLVAGNTSLGQANVYHGSATGLTLAASLASATPTFGRSVSMVGDVDLDGYDDVAVGADGEAYVYAGTSAGVSPVSPTVLAEGGSTFGAVLAGAGDVDGDGDPDLAVATGPSGFDVLGSFSIYAGDPAGLATTPWVHVAGRPDPYFGRAVASAGDVDGDGYDDVLIGAPDAYAEDGTVYLYRGGPSGLGTLATDVLAGTPEAPIGAALDGGGDLDGDGWLDVVVGSWYVDPPTVQVFRGGPAGIESTPATILTGDASARDLGSAIAVAGDVNGDGYDDVIVGDPGYGGAFSYYGAWFVHHGGPTGLSPVAARSVTNSSLYDELGAAVAGIGDVNGDGYDDVAVADPYDRGLVEAYLGSATGVAAAPQLSVTGTSSSARLGTGLAGAGDVNADGYDDLVVGAPGIETAWVYYGGPTGLGAATSFTSTAVDFGLEVAGVGDLDGDGYDDVAIASADEVWIHAGSPVGVSVVASVTLAGESGSGFGDELAGGDLDGDGLADLVVGAFLADGRTGSVSVFLGSGDGDGDGYGAGEDCDDGNALVNPGAVERCDAADLDQDCDGLADDDDPSAANVGKTTFYRDTDGDGHAGPMTGTFCDLPASGWGATAEDCDDDDASVHPSATEACDAGDVDEDCDGDADDADGSVDPATRGTFHLDADGDGFGGAVTVASCDLPPGYVADDTDCDDTLGSVHPAAPEVCDPADADEDCDGLADDDDDAASGPATWFPDADGDGHGAGAPVEACDPPPGHTAANDDCDDASDAVHPGALEVCDESDVDEDCDGLADDADPTVDPATRSSFHADLDGDGFGDPATAAPACDAAPGQVLDGTDCDDAARTLSPAATEVPDDGVDQDCDGRDTCRADADGDGHAGDALVVTTDGDCADPGELAGGDPGDDCDDADATIHAGAPETDCADPVDRNCDGSFGSTDADGDGAPACGDCRDDDAGVGPGAAETCDGLDQDCDGLADELPVADGDTWHADADQDGYTDPATSVVACDPPAGHAARSLEDDCDDGDAAVRPGAAEATADGIDQDCDGDEICWLDADGDGWRPDATSTQASADLDCDDPGEAGAAAADGDCRDDRPDAWPGAPEVPDDGVDQDCDGADATDEGTTDPGPTDPTTPTGGTPEPAPAEPAGCGCSGTGAPALSALLAVAALARRRRRSSQGRRR